MTNKKRKIPYFPMFVIGFFVLLFVLNQRSEESDMSNTENLEPDNHLDKATEEFAQQRSQQGIEEIEKAILSMKELERTMEASSEIQIDLAIAKLKSFERHIKGDSLNSAELDYAFANAINALALTQLKLSKFDLHHDKKQEAKEALKITMSHLLHAMKYSDSIHEQQEKGLIRRVEILIYSIDHEKAYERQLNELIEEVQNLVKTSRISL